MFKLFRFKTHKEAASRLSDAERTAMDSEARVDQMEWAIAKSVIEADEIKAKADLDLRYAKAELTYRRACVDRLLRLSTEERVSESVHELRQVNGVLGVIAGLGRRAERRAEAEAAVPA